VLIISYACLQFNRRWRFSGIAHALRNRALIATRCRFVAVVLAYDRFLTAWANRTVCGRCKMWWTQSWIALQQEFSDLGDAGDVTRVCVRLFVALVLGAILGYERESVGASAGLRTHMLVSVGSALFILVPLQAGMRLEDVSRVLQGITAGVGFLGAGAILKLQSDNQIRGLTTAAGIWLTSAVGVAAGMGLEATAVLSALLALAILSLLRMTKGK
jgi:putative Mg2+ transporter-C (MgtC) family protein